jgi:uncharacterized membrane protein
MKKPFVPILVTLFVVSAYAILQSNSTNIALSLNATPSKEISYSSDVRPILESRCSKCHMGEFTSKNLNMETYESLMTGSQNGPVIVAGSARESLLAQKISKGEMPKRGPKLTPEQIQIIIDWINAGAKDN